MEKSKANDLIRDALLGESVDVDGALAALDGDRPNPTGRPLPPGNVAVIWPTGRIEQKSIRMGEVLALTGHATPLWTAADVRKVLGIPRGPEAAEDAATPSEEDVPEPVFDPGGLTVRQLEKDVLDVDDPGELEVLLEAELHGKNRDTAVDAIKQRRDEVLEKME